MPGLAGNLVHLYLHQPMELAAWGDLQLHLPIACGMQVQGGSPLVAKVLHLPRMLQRYLMQGHYALITRRARAYRQP